MSTGSQYSRSVIGYTSALVAMAVIGAAMAELARHGWLSASDIGLVLAAGHTTNNAELEMVRINIFTGHQRHLLVRSREARSEAAQLRAMADRIELQLPLMSLTLTRHESRGRP